MSRVMADVWWKPCRPQKVPAAKAHLQLVGAVEEGAVGVQVDGDIAQQPVAGADLDADFQRSWARKPLVLVRMLLKQLRQGICK